MVMITAILSELDNLEREESALRETPVYRYHRNKHKRKGHASTEEQSLRSLVTTFMDHVYHARVYISFMNYGHLFPFMAFYAT